MSDTLVDVTIKVPSIHIGALYQFAATLHETASAPPTTRKDDTTSKEAEKDSAGGLSAEAITEAYTGGVSDYWRPFLMVLAEQGGEWVAWQDLCKAIDLEPSRAAGMIGAAERRCGPNRPYEKAYESSTYWFRMPVEVANKVRELASSQP